jgi:hypothetical protein
MQYARDLRKQTANKLQARISLTSAFEKYKVRQLIPLLGFFFFFSLHTYLLDSALAHELGTGGTSPPLHIGVARIVYLASVT